MAKAVVNLSLNKELARSVQENLDKENKVRVGKFKKAFTKSEFYQNLIVIGLIIHTNKREDIPKVLKAYFEDESQSGGQR